MRLFNGGVSLRSVDRRSFIGFIICGVDERDFVSFLISSVRLLLSFICLSLFVPFNGELCVDEL